MNTEPLSGHPKFVGVTEERADGLVEFLFAIDDPRLNVELVMPRAIFDAFCDAQKVQFLAVEDMQTQEGDDFGWSLKQARERRLG